MYLRNLKNSLNVVRKKWIYRPMKSDKSYEREGVRGFKAAGLDISRSSNIFTLLQLTAVKDYY